MAIETASLSLLSRTLTREAHVLAAEPNRLASHVHNTLWLEHGPRAPAGPLLEGAAAALGDRLWLKLANRPPIGAAGRTGLLRTFQGDAVRALAWAPDSRTIAIAGEGPVLVWDAATGAQAGRLQSGGGTGAVVRDLAWSPDGAALAWCGEEVPVTLCDPRTGQVQDLKGPRMGGTSLAWRPDGASLAVGTADGEVRVCDLLALEVRPSRFRGRGRVNGLAWAPHGDRLAVASDGNVVLVWEVPDANLLAEGEHDTPVIAVAWSADDRTLAYTGFDLALAVVDLGTWEATPRKLPWVAFSVAWSPDGRTVAAGLNDGSVAWLSLDGQAGRVQAQGEPVGSVAFSPDGRLLASGSADGTACLWDVAELFEQPAADDEAGHNLPVRAVAWAADGSLMASASTDSTVRLWSADAGEARGKLDHDGPVNAVAWSHTGGTLASGELGLMWSEETQTETGLPVRESQRTGVLRIWERGSDDPKGAFPGVSEVVNGLAWSPDDSVLAAAAADGSVWLLDARTGELRQVGDKGGAEAFAVAWSPDGGRLAAGDADGAIRMWDAHGAALEPLSCDRGPVGALAWSPDGARLAAGTAGAVRVFDAPACTSWDDLRGHRGDVVALAWSADSALIAGADSEKDVRLWDASSGGCVSAARTLSPVDALRFDENGAVLSGADTGAASGHRPLPYRFELRNTSRS